MKNLLFLFLFGLIFLTFSDASAISKGDDFTAIVEKELQKESNDISGKAVVLN